MIYNVNLVANHICEEAYIKAKALHKNGFKDSKESISVYEGLKSLWTSGDALNREICYEYWGILLDDVNILDTNYLEYVCLNEIFPLDIHNVKEGSWILVLDHHKIKPMTLVFAKYTSRKKSIKNTILQRFKKDSFDNEKENNNEYLITGALKKLNNSLNKIENKILKLYSKQISSLIDDLEIENYNIKVQVENTKGKLVSHYLIPGQYIVIDDIDRYINYALNNKDLKINCLNNQTEEFKNKVFYLQSRGISLNKAQIMASMNQLYLTMPQDIVDLYLGSFIERSKVLI
jgi:hypothetical protein